MHWGGEGHGVLLSGVLAYADFSGRMHEDTRVASEETEGGEVCGKGASHFMPFLYFFMQKVKKN